MKRPTLNELVQTLENGAKDATEMAFVHNYSKYHNDAELKAAFTPEIVGKTVARTMWFTGHALAYSHPPIGLVWLYETIKDNPDLTRAFYDELSNPENHFYFVHQPDELPAPDLRSRYLFFSRDVEDKESTLKKGASSTTVHHKKTDGVFTSSTYKHDRSSIDATTRDLFRAVAQGHLPTAQPAPEWVREQAKAALQRNP